MPRDLVLPADYGGKMSIYHFRDLTFDPGWIAW